jgi:hypothetical protein
MDAAIGLAGFSGRLEENAGVGCPAQAAAGGRDSGVVPRRTWEDFSRCVSAAAIYVFARISQAWTQFAESKSINGDTVRLLKGSQRCPSECSRHVHVRIEG